MSKRYRPQKGVDVSDADLPLVRFPVLGSPKIDGIRGNVQKDGLRSTRLKKFPNLHANRMFGRPEYHGLDGELAAGPITAPNVFNATTRAMKNVEGGEDVKFYVFDTFFFPDLPYNERLLMLGRMKLGPKVQIVKQTLVKNVKELRAFETKMLELGYEGAMFRSLDGRYKFGRSTLNEQYLMKRKPTEDSEGYVTGFEEQMENTNPQELNELGLNKRSSKKAGMKPKGTLGAMILWDPKLNWEVRVATIKGWTEEDRQEAWDERHKILREKRWMKYRFQRVGVVNKARQPRGLGWRMKEDL